MDPSTVTALTLVTGWVTTHFLTLRAQRRNLENQLRNDARVQCIKALRSYQKWLDEVSSKVGTFKFGKVPPPGDPTWSEKRWTDEALAHSQLFFSRRSTSWQMVLEEHEVFFPAARRAVRQLQVRHRELFNLLSEFNNHWWLERTRELIPRPASDAWERAREQVALVDYLRIYIQNVTLGRIIGRKQPPTGPRDISLLRLSEGSAGAVEFTFGTPPSRRQQIARRFFGPRIKAILHDGLPEQAALFDRIKSILAGLPALHCDVWVQGEGVQMGVEILDYETQRSLWITTGQAAEIATQAEAELPNFFRLPAQPQHLPLTASSSTAQSKQGSGPTR